MREHDHGANAWHVAAIAIALAALLAAMLAGGWGFDGFLAAIQGRIW